MSLWKRNAVIVAIVLFVGAAVYLNWSYNRTETADGTADAENSADGRRRTAGPRRRRATLPPPA